MAKPKVVIADDHDMVRETISEILQDDFEVLAKLADGHSLLEAVKRLKPDAAVVDISMPGMSGIEAAELLKPEENVAIVFLTTLSDPAVVARALMSGGLGYVLKAVAERDLAPALHAALQGRQFISAFL